MEFIYATEGCSVPKEECKILQFAKNFRKGLSIAEVKDLCTGVGFEAGNKEFYKEVPKGVMMGVDDTLLIFNCTGGILPDSKSGFCGSLIACDEDAAINENVLLAVQAIKAR